MSIFFLMRIHFVFNRSKLRINKVMMYCLLFLIFSSAVVASVGGIGGPLHVFGEHDFTIPSRLGFSAAVMGIVTDLWITALYVERLIRIVKIQSEVTVTTRRSTCRSQTSDSNKKRDTLTSPEFK